MDRAGRGAETQNKIIVVILDLFKIIKYHCHRFILVFVILVFFVIVMQWTLGRAGQWVVPKQDQTGLDRSARSTLDFGARYQGIKVSRSQGECSDGCDRGDGATSVTELKVNVICEAGEAI